MSRYTAILILKFIYCGITIATIYVEKYSYGQMVEYDFFKFGVGFGCFVDKLKCWKVYFCKPENKGLPYYSDIGKITFRINRRTFVNLSNLDDSLERWTKLLKLYEWLVLKMRQTKSLNVSNLI